MERRWRKEVQLILLFIPSSPIFRGWGGGGVFRYKFPISCSHFWEGAGGGQGMGRASLR